MTAPIQQQVLDLKKAFANASTTIASGLDKALIKAGLLVERDAKLYLTEDQHVDTGRLRASITHRLIDKFQGHAVQIGTKVQYAEDIEFGTGPHHVPIDELIAWVHRKGLTGGGYARNKMGRGMRLADEKNLAYEIQQHIEKYGTKPHPFLLPALESNAVAIRAMITKELQKSIKEAGK